MALIFQSWQADGNGQTLLSSVRSDTKDWYKKSEDWLTHQKRDPRCVLITKSLTDQQSNISLTIWSREGYSDPCT